MITAAYGGVIQQTSVIVAPQNTITLASFTIAPLRVVGGNPSAGTVTLNAPAPPGGAVVAITTRRRNMVSVPQSITITEGITSATFAIGTDVVHGSHDRSVAIDATYSGITRTATLTIAPASSTALTPPPVAQCASATIVPCITANAARGVVMSVTPQQQYSLYSPELNLLAETQPISGAAPAIAYEYIWFGGVPLAQIEVPSGTTHLYLNDHLGTPILTANATAIVDWRIEREPYGEIFVTRAGLNRYQPLVFPGQEDDRTSDRSYNIHRWYESSWGRYIHSDPIGLEGGMNLYTYASSNPITSADPLGLYRLRIRGSAFPISLNELDRLCHDSRGNVTGGACTTSFAATATCPCSCSGSTWEMDLTVYISFTSYYFGGPWRQLTQTRQPHRSVTDANTALLHEMDYHLLPAERLLRHVLEPYEQISYGSEQECNTACANVRSLIVNEYRRLVRTTQQFEEAGGNPSTWR